MRIVGVVLAAGQSRRMGQPKAMLHCHPGDETFVARIVRVLGEAGLSDILVIGRPEDDGLRRVVGELQPAARFVENPAPERGQLSSLLVGLDHADHARADGVLVLPVDTPLVRARTIADALDQFRVTGASIVRVVHRGQHGHPVIFGVRVFNELREADISVGAKAVIRRHADDLLNLEVDDPGVLRDVDLPEDYRSLFGTDPV